MTAVALWVRSILRRHWAATVALALLAGLSAGVVGACFQAARRADGAIERHAERSRSFDGDVYGCPPGVDPSTFESFALVLERCSTREVAERIRAEVLAFVPEVESSAVLATLVAGIIDGPPQAERVRVGLVTVFGSIEADVVASRQILVEGRLPDPTAPDEVVISETAARVGRIHAGDTIRLASWHQGDIDAAGDIPPQTEPFDSLVVGVIRTISDVQFDGDGGLTGNSLPGEIFALRGWTKAHASGFATYGSAVGVRLRDGAAGIHTLQETLSASPGGWYLDTEASVDVDVDALQRIVDAERQAVIVFALIAALAGFAFVGLTLGRQLRLELAEAPTLLAMGLTRSHVGVGAVGRALASGVLAAVLAVGTMLALSRLGPVGIARRLEYAHPVRLDWLVLAVVSLAILVFFAGVAVVVVVVAGRSPQHRVRRGVAGGSALPAVPSVAMNFARGGSPRLAVAVGAVAISGVVAAGALLASFDRVIAQSIRYGAWWDVAVGNYSDPDAEQQGVDLVRANPFVTDAAAFVTNSFVALLDGQLAPFLAPIPVVGRPETVMASGRAPVEFDEVALGAVTARRLQKGIGDTITLTSSVSSLETELPAPPFSQTVRVTGIAVLNNPVQSASNAGEGVVIHPDLVDGLSLNSTPQSIAIRFDPNVDRATAEQSIVRDFPGSARRTPPQADLRNLARIRFVPWLIAALVGVLALASLVHALVTLLQRHSRDLAVLAALGMTRGQRRRVGWAAGAVLIGGSIVIGVPLGLVLGRWIWRVVARRMSIPSGPVMAWVPTLVAPLVALAVAFGVAVLAARWVTRRSPAAQLRTE